MLLVRTFSVVACLALMSSTKCSAAEAYVPGPDEHHVGYRRTLLEYEGSDAEKRERSVLIWYPTLTAAQEYNYRGQVGFVAKDAKVAAGKHPVILFSHGFLGMPDQSVFLTEGLARKGYIVAAIGHSDGLLAKRDKPIPAPNFGDGKNWTEDNFRDRREDVVALLDHLLAESKRDDSIWSGKVNSAAVGAAGHSLGGYTALGLIGGWEKATEQRIKAALVLSPYSAPYLSQGNLAGVTVPVMFQGGTLDWGITPLIPGVYKKLAGPKYYLVLQNETHFGWTNLIALGKTTTAVAESGNAKLMLDYSAAFFDRHLCGEKEVPPLTEKHPKLKSYEFEVIESSGE